MPIRRQHGGLQSDGPQDPHGLAVAERYRREALSDGSGARSQRLVHVVFPADPRRCETCHNSKSGAAQATAHLTNPTAEACGACHDDVNFASGVNHAGGPQINNNQCSTCHTPQGRLDFDASIKGAHVVPDRFVHALRADCDPGERDARHGGQSSRGHLHGKRQKRRRRAGCAARLSFSDHGRAHNRLRLHEFRKRRHHQGLCHGKRHQSAVRSGWHVCLYLPAFGSVGRTGTYSIGIEARRTETLLPNTDEAMIVTYGAPNKVINFAVDGSAIQARRAVVATSNCNQCHVALSFMALFATKPNIACCATILRIRILLSARTRVFAPDKARSSARHQLQSAGASDPLRPERCSRRRQAVHQSLVSEEATMISRDVRFPALSPQGVPGDRRNCSLCHVNGSEQNPSRWV